MGESDYHAGQFESPNRPAINVHLFIKHNHYLFLTILLVAMCRLFSGDWVAPNIRTPPALADFFGHLGSMETSCKYHTDILSSYVLMWQAC